MSSSPEVAAPAAAVISWPDHYQIFLDGVRWMVDGHHLMDIQVICQEQRIHSYLWLLTLFCPKLRGNLPLSPHSDVGRPNGDAEGQTVMSDCNDTDKRDSSVNVEHYLHKSDFLPYLLQLIYYGKVCLPPNDVHEFVKASQKFGIEGLLALPPCPNGKPASEMTSVKDSVPAVKETEPDGLGTPNGVAVPGISEDLQPSALPATDFDSNASAVKNPSLPPSPHEISKSLDAPKNESHEDAGCFFRLERLASCFVDAIIDYKPGDSSSEDSDEEEDEVLDALLKMCDKYPMKLETPESDVPLDTDWVDSEALILEKGGSLPPRVALKRGRPPGRRSKKNRKYAKRKANGAIRNPKGPRGCKRSQPHSVVLRDGVQEYDSELTDSRFGRKRLVVALQDIMTTVDNKQEEQEEEEEGPEVDQQPSDPETREAERGDKGLHAPWPPYKDRDQEVCSHCGYETWCKYAMKCHALRHSQAVDTDGCVCCPSCDETFATVDECRDHILEHCGPEDLYTCFFCAFYTHVKVDWLRHLAMKHSSDWRGRPISRKHRIECERGSGATHAGEQRAAKNGLQCPLCREVDFRGQSDLHGHMLQEHGSELGSTCGHCGTVCKSEESLEAHQIMVGNGSQCMPFKCNLCEKYTRTLGGMRKHQTVMHYGSRGITCIRCQGCELIFSDPTDIEEHIMDVHVKLKKELVGMGFKTFSRKNILIHRDNQSKNTASHSSYSLTDS